MANPAVVVDYLANTKGLTDGLKGMRRGFKTAGVVAAAGFGVAAVATKHLIDAASDLNESINAVQVVFGKASKEVLAFSGKAAKQAGLSMTEFNSLVTPVGASLRNVGLSASEAAHHSIELTKRAADMASVFNTDVPTALEAIQAGLRGEADPLERFGVGLSDAAIQAEAVREGMKKTNGQLTANQKATARLAIIYRQTDRLQGDFKNTSGGLANALRIIHAEFGNIQARLGSVLLPVVARAASGFADFLAKVGEAKGIGAKFRVAVGELGRAAQSIFDSLRAAIGRIDWAGIWAQAQGLAQGLQDALGRVDWGAIGKLIGSNIAAAVALAAPQVQKALSKVVETARQINWVKLGKAMGPGLAAALVTAFVTLTDPVFWIKNWDLALAVMVTVFTRGTGKIAAKLAAPLTRLGVGIIERILVGIERASPGLANALLAALTKLPGVVTRGLALLSAPVQTVMKRLGGLARFTVKVLGIQAAINAIAQLGTRIAAASVQIATDAYNLGRDLVQGLINGMQSLAGALVQKAKDIAMAPINKFKQLTHTGSPSKVWAALGRDTIAGYILGITQSLPALKGKTAEAVQRSLDAARSRVAANQDRFRAAFEKLADFATRAFQARTDSMLAKISASFDVPTPAEAALAAIQASEAERGRVTELAAAQAAVAAAKTDQEKTDAAEQLRQAQLAITIAGLEATAAVERAAADAAKATALQDAEELRRQQAAALDAQLAQLEAKLAEHPKRHAKIQKQILALLGRFGVDYEQAGEDLGNHFAAGMRASEAQVEAAAKHLAKIVARYLPHSPAEKGPLARTDFFRDFGPMLAANLLRGRGAIEGAALGLANAAAVGLSPGIEARTGGPLSVRVFIGETELKGIVRTEVEGENTRTAQTLLAGMA